MKIFFWDNGGNLLDNYGINDTAPYFHEAPKLELELKLLDLAINTQSITLKFFYDKDNADQNGSDKQKWNYFLQQNYKNIHRIALRNDNNVTTYFDGYVDPEAEIYHNHVDAYLEMQFLGKISQYLDTLVDQEVSIFNTFERPPTAFQNFVTEFFENYIPDYTPEFDSSVNWANLMPIVGLIDIGAYPYRRYILPVQSNETKVYQVIKDICILAGVRAFIEWDTIKFIPLENTLQSVDHDGKLQIKASRKKYIDVFESDLNCDWQIQYNAGLNFPYVSSETISNYIDTYYNNLATDEINEYDIVGLNSNLEPGNIIELDGLTLTLSKIKKDLAYIDADLQPVEITAMRITYT